MRLCDFFFLNGMWECVCEYCSSDVLNFSKTEPYQINNVIKRHEKEEIHWNLFLNSMFSAFLAAILVPLNVECAIDVSCLWMISKGNVQFKQLFTSWYHNRFSFCTCSIYIWLILPYQVGAICVCVYTYIHTHTHTYTQIYIYIYIYIYILHHLDLLKVTGRQKESSPFCCL